MSNNKMPASNCPYCERRLDAATHMFKSVNPKVGDLTVCISCSQILVFGERLILRKPEANEVEKIFKEDPAFAQEVDTLQKVIRAVDRSEKQQLPDMDKDSESIHGGVRCIIELEYPKFDYILITRNPESGAFMSSNLGPEDTISALESIARENLSANKVK